jgi:hypothetical protein
LDIASELGLAQVGPRGLVDREAFESIYNPGKLVLLTSWKNATAAAAWQPNAIAGSGLRHRRIRIIRDYGMFDRREATQYYPLVDSKNSARSPRE